MRQEVVIHGRQNIPKKINGLENFVDNVELDVGAVWEGLEKTCVPETVILDEHLFVEF